MTPELPVARAAPTGPAICTPNQVAIATFLGSPLAGGIVLALAHRRAGTGRAWTALLAGVGMTALLVALAYVLPGQVGFGVAAGGLFGMRALAQAQHPGLVAAAGGMPGVASWWGVIGVSIGALALCAVSLGGIGLYGWFDPPAISFGHDQDVQYTDGATKAEARIVGTTLLEMGFFEPNGKDKTVRVERDHGRFVISFVVTTGAWDRPEIVEAFGQVRARFQQLFPSSPVVVHLCDEMLDNQHTIE